MMSMTQTMAGRASMGAWRSRKQVLWGACLIVCGLLIYVQILPSSIPVEVDLQNQQYHQSYRPQDHERDNHIDGNVRRVQFLSSPKTKENEVKEEDRGNRRVIISADQPKGNIVEGNHESTGNSQKDWNSIATVQKIILNQHAPSAPRVIEQHGLQPAPVVLKQQESVLSNAAAAAWSGGSFKYNPYGEPVYDHGNRANYIPKERVIHLDLKGAPPRASTYKILIPWLAKNGATSILLEYEDMFPWEGSLAPLAASNHYTKEEIQDIIKVCKENHIQIIPLVQTFGHLEFALKLPVYRHLREVPELPQAICPSLNDSQSLVKTMVDQVMALHLNAKYLHIGCDEVYQMGECERCRVKSRENLFLDHVANTAKYVKAKYGIIPLIWHDMLTHVSESAMKEYQFGELVEPMVWVYAEDIYRFVQPSMWSKFAQVFPHVWGASAFKGAFGEQSVVPNVRRHLDNNLNWLDVMASEAPKFSGGFRGLVLTGWQRHDHFAVLCELLPAALPSLAVNLIAASHGFFNSSVHDQLYQALNCMQAPKYQTGLNLDSDPFLWDKFSWCFFPGSLIFKSTARLDAAKLDVRGYIDRVTNKRGWISEYNRRHNFSSPMRIDQDLEEMSLRIHTVTLLLKTAKDALSEWFDEWTTGEWIEQRVWPILHELEQLQREAESMKKLKIWPPRPLPLLPELAVFGITEPGKKVGRKDKPSEALPSPINGPVNRIRRNVY